MVAFANLAISVLRVLGKKNVKRAMSSFELRPNTADAAAWSAVRPTRQQLGRSRTAAGGRGAPVRGHGHDEPCRTVPTGTPRHRSGTQQHLWLGASVGDRGRKTR